MTTPTERDMMDMLLKRLDIKYQTLRAIQADITHINPQSDTYTSAWKAFSEAINDIWKFKSVWDSLREFWKE